MVTIGSHLYRTDDCYMSTDDKSGDAVIQYDIESSQPRLGFDQFVDPDRTRLLISSQKIQRTKKKVWYSLDGANIQGILTGVIVIGAIGYGMLSYIGI